MTKTDELREEVKSLKHQIKSRDERIKMLLDALEPHMTDELEQHLIKVLGI